MTWQYPQILYALFLLIIPILIHFFRFRKYQKVWFTNVAFLKSVKQEEHAKSQLKKWILLLTRLLVLACIIFAFAKPIKGEHKTQENAPLVIYLDNSFSMQAQGENGDLLNRAKQELIAYLPEKQSFSLFTNQESFIHMTKTEIHNHLVGLSFSPNQLSSEAVIEKAKQLMGSKKIIKSDLVLISDFQKKQNNWDFKSDSLTNTYYIQAKPLEKNNESIDSLSLIEQKTLRVWLSPHSNISRNVSLWEGNSLLSKGIVEPAINRIDFDISHKEAFNGKVQLEDQGLSYDNIFYFSIQKTIKPRVLCIQNQPDTFLNRIYTKNDFNFTSVSYSKLQFNILENYEVLILYELEKFSAAFDERLKEFVNQGGTLVFVPSENGEIVRYNSFFGTLGLPLWKSKRNDKVFVNQIEYDHPFFKNTFSKRTFNFDYPFAKIHFVAPKVGSLLKYNTQAPFLYKQDQVFIFTSPLNLNQSNFQNTPLIVPVFYKIGIQSNTKKTLYYKIGGAEKMFIPVPHSEEQVVRFEKNGNEFIPLQKFKNGRVEVSVSQYPERDGHYNAMINETLYDTYSFNYNRDESKLEYRTLPSHIKTYNSFKELQLDLKNKSEIHWLWKWFLILAIIFLVGEVLLLKWIKE